MAKTVVGLFDGNIKAQRAIQELASAGFPRNDIDLIAKNGAPIVAGDIVDNLARMGVPNEEARHYSSGVDSGKAVVVVKTSDAAVQRAVTVLERNGAKDLDQRQRDAMTTSGITGTQTTGLTGAPGAAKSKEATIPVIEEDLKVGKREVQRRGVRVYSRIVEEPVEKEVSLRQEHVDVERHPVNRPASEQELRDFKEGTIEMTERVEEPVVAKEARVVEEVVVSKDVTQQDRTIRDTVRKTEVNVDETGVGEAGRVAGAGARTAEGSVPVPGDENELSLARDDVRNAEDVEARKAEARNPSNFRSEVANEFRDDSPGSSGTMPDREYAHTYAETLASDPRYRGKDWNAIEPEAQREWATHRKGAWEEFKDMIRHAWEKMAGH